jgi:hypothetical protein
MLSFCASYFCLFIVGHVVYRLRHNDFQIYGVWAFQHKCWCGEPNFDQPQMSLRSTEPPLLPNLF